MSLLRDVVYGAIRYAGPATMGRRLRPGALVLCYHNVVEGAVVAEDKGLHLARSDFQAQMAWLATHFTVVTLDELHARVSSGRSVRGLAAVTFDDAYVGAMTHGLAVLRALGLPATVFVASGYPGDARPFWWDLPAAAGAATDAARRTRFIEDLRGDAEAILAGVPAVPDAVAAQCRPATWDLLRASRSESVRLEAHSVTHRTLPRLTDAELDQELRTCATTLEQELGSRPRWLAYPYGRWDTRVAAATRAVGYLGAWTLAGRDVTAHTDWASAPRLNVPAGIALDAFVAWGSGLAHWRSKADGG